MKKANRVAPARAHEHTGAPCLQCTEPAASKEAVLAAESAPSRTASRPFGDTQRTRPANRESATWGAWRFRSNVVRP
jgi:hypothetical protein